MARVRKNQIPEAQIEENEGLVPLTKDGEVMFVHPSCVEDHKRLDWVEAE